MLLDGGDPARRDVVKALALGARAVMIGRAYLWGLAANGQAGWRTCSTCCAAGSSPPCWAWASVHDLTPDDVIVPPDFTRVLGQ